MTPLTPQQLDDLAGGGRGMKEEPSTMTTVAVDIGCLECGESSALIGVFATREEAAVAAKAYAAEHGGDWNDEYSSGGYFDGGQHSIELMEEPR